MVSEIKIFPKLDEKHTHTQSHTIRLIVIINAGPGQAKTIGAAVNCGLMFS